MLNLSQDLIWWITVVELPALAGLLALVMRTRNDTNKAVTTMRQTLDQRCDQLRDALGAFRLEVAKSYASQSDMKHLEKRLVSHLLRIEAKLDTTALKAEALSAHNKK